MATNPAIAVAMTGASGAAYGLQLIKELLGAGETVYLMMSNPARLVVESETSLSLPSKTGEIRRLLSEHLGVSEHNLHVFAKEDWLSPLASGSHAPRAMVVCPCTTGTLGALASGTSRSLIERAADVILKEQRKLILVVRETPLSLIHLENMLTLARAGALIMPANPGFYYNPKCVDDLVTFMVARILDHLDINHDLIARWGKERVDE